VITIPTTQKRKTSSWLGGGIRRFALNILFNENESLLFQDHRRGRGAIRVRHLNGKKKPDHLASCQVRRGPFVARLDLLAGGGGPLLPSHHHEHAVDRVAASRSVVRVPY
jgi:hypothetical protein